MAMTQDKIVLEVNDLRTYIFNRTSTVKAVDGISFFLRKGETLGIVGASGCGKTMTALSLPMTSVRWPGCATGWW